MTLRLLALSAPLLLAGMTMPAIAAALPFDTPAPIAFMTDLSSGAVLFAKDADRRMPPASMAKMMTVYVAFDMIRHGDLKLDQTFTVRPETWKKWHSQGSTMFLGTGEQVSVANLLAGIVTLSGNDACVVLAEGISGTEPAFVALMNDHARKLGLANSHFGTANGWPDGGVTYVSARDLATLASATVHNFPDLYKQFYARPNFTWGKTLGSNQDITQANRDPILGRVAGADGLKTGHTEEAGYGFTGSAEQNGRRLVMVLAGLDSASARVSQSVAFMDWGFGAWRSRPIVKKGKQVETAEVQLGDHRTVGLVAPADVAVTIPTGSNAPVKVKVVYDGPLKAPIKAGDHVADLVVSTSDTQPQVTPLVAAASVGKAGFLDRVGAGFHHLIGG